MTSHISTNRKPGTVIAGLLAYVAVMGLWLGVNTQAVNAAGSITVSPAYERVSVSSAQPENTVSIAVRSDFIIPVSIEASVTAVDLSGGSLVPVTGAGDGVVDAIQLSQTNYTLEPGKSVNIGVQVQNTDALAPGGHYAAVVIRQVASQGQQIPLEPAVSVALFIVKEDGAIRDVTAQTASIGSVRVAMPKSTTVTFSTKGNVDVIPHASIAIVKDVATNVFLQGVANDAARPLYPGSELKLQTNMYRIQTPRWPGKYAVLTRYRYQGQDQPQETAQWFWYIPAWFIGAVIACILLLSLLLRIGYRRIRARHRLVRKHHKTEVKTSSESIV